MPSTLVLGLLARVLPLERTMAELQALRKAARHAQQKATVPTVEASTTEREIAWLKDVCRALSDQVEQLTEAVDHLQRERAD